MKQLISTLGFCLILFCCFAQVPKQKLGFIPYSDPSGDKYGYREMAYNNLYEAATRIFINTQRFDILDRSKFDIVKLEKNFTKGDDFINSEIVAQGKAQAAEILAVAKVTALSITEADDKKGWSAFFTVEFKQIDVESSKAVNAVQLKGDHEDGAGILGGSSILGSRAKSPEQAISKAVTKMEDALNKWIHDNFPIKLLILDRDDSLNLLYARGGKDLGITIRNDMCIRRIRKLKSGDIIVETVAELKFTKIDGVGELTTKFEPKNKKDWEKIVKVLTDFPNEVFIMECISKGSFLSGLRK